VWSSADGVNWNLVNDNVPWAPRVLHYTVAFGGKIWVIGGQTVPEFAPAAEAFYNDFWCTEDGVSWERVLEHAPWEPRGMIGGSAVLNGRIWILGGGRYYQESFNDVWSSADGAHWDQHTEAAPWHGRQYHDVAVFDGRLWLLEGCSHPGGNRNDVWFSADGSHWKELPNTPWAPRHAASVFVYDDALWMVAGNNMQSDVWKLTMDE
jgi:N-acetylneuraminic acid mutarotase